LLAVGLVSDRGGARCNPGRGQAIAAGQANLLSPTPPRMGRVEAANAGRQISFYQETQTGGYRKMGDNENMWSRS
jgi:hypothetical protein